METTKSDKNKNLLEEKMKNTRWTKKNLMDHLIHLFCIEEISVSTGVREGALHASSSIKRSVEKMAEKLKLEDLIIEALGFNRKTLQILRFLNEIINFVETEGRAKDVPEEELEEVIELFNKMAETILFLLTREGDFSFSAIEQILREFLEELSEKSNWIEIVKFVDYELSDTVNDFQQF